MGYWRSGGVSSHLQRLNDITGEKDIDISMLCSDWQDHGVPAQEW